VAAPAHAFACELCGRPLSAGRFRQGVRFHKECRALRRESERPPAQREAAAALERTQATLARLTAEGRDPELRELFAQAAAQARELAGDLERLRSLSNEGQR
jgi:hypothetical protein